MQLLHLAAAQRNPPIFIFLENGVWKVFLNPFDGTGFELLLYNALAIV